MKKAKPEGQKSSQRLPWLRYEERIAYRGVEGTFRVINGFGILMEMVDT